MSVECEPERAEMMRTDARLPRRRDALEHVAHPATQETPQHRTADDRVGDPAGDPPLVDFFTVTGVMSESAALVDAEQVSGASARDGHRNVAIAVLVQDQLSRARVAERPRGDGEPAVVVAPQLDARAGDDGCVLELLAREVEGDIPEAVDGEHRGPDPRRVDLGLGHVEADELGGVDRWTELGDRHAGGEVRRGGREEVAAVERP